MCLPTFPLTTAIKHPPLSETLMRGEKVKKNKPQIHPPDSLPALAPSTPRKGLQLTHTRTHEHIPACKSTHVPENHIQAHTFLIHIHGCGRRSWECFSIRAGQHSCPREEATVNSWMGCCWNQRRGLDTGHQEELGR